MKLFTNYDLFIVDVVFKMHMVEKDSEGGQRIIGVQYDKGKGLREKPMQEQATLQASALTLQALANDIPKSSIYHGKRVRMCINYENFPHNQFAHMM